MKLFLQLFSIICCFIVFASQLFAADIYSAGFAGTPIKGSWSQTTTWDGGNVPGPGDNVYIIGMDSIILDVPELTINDLTIGGDDTYSTLTFVSTDSVKLTIEGSLLINPKGSFRNTGSTLATDPVIDSIFVYGDFINNGACLSFRAGSQPKYGVTYVVFVGENDSHLKSTGAYNQTTNRFNGITINKTSPGKVILDSDIILDGGSSSYPTSQPYLDLKNGIVETGAYSIVTLSTAANSPNPIIVNASKKSYVIGSVGRGMSSSSVTTREFPLGDADGYRPIKIHNATGGSATGHNLRVRLIRGNANPSNSSLSGGIDKVSSVRYYQLSYDSSNNSAATMSFDKFSPSYGEQDGVVEGNSNLRIAYTTDNLINWKGLDQLAIQDTTMFLDPPDFWNADSLPAGSWITLTEGGQSAYVAIARATGTTENTLNYTPVGVNEEQGVPATFLLKQNYPNPFNPTTTIEYFVPVRSAVVLEVYNVLGQMVDRLVDAELSAGTYTMEYNASALSSGVYYYRLSTPTMTLTNSMLLAK